MADDVLGTGEYEVYFKSRGGQHFICRARNMTALTWGRTLNDVSSASVTIGLNDLETGNCECISQINPWEHELAVYRNGVEVWVGPVVNGTIDLAKLSATYDARDLSTWFDHRWVEPSDSDVEFSEVDITEVFTWLIEHAYYKQPWNMSWSIPRIQIPIDRTYTGASPGERWNGSFQNVGEELRALSDSGIDTTVVGRNYIAGDLQSESTPNQILIDNHWSTLPLINIVGGAMATEVGVGGGNGGYYGWYDDQIWIERADDDEAGEKYGLLQSFFNAPDLDEEVTTELPNAITQQAYGLRELKKQPFIYVKGGALSHSAPTPINSLVPGISVFKLKLNNTCRQVEDTYRLQSMTANYSKNGESVEIELVPLGADALRS